MNMLEEVRKLVEVSEEDLKKQVILKRKDDLFYLLLNKKANTFSHQFVRDINKALDEIEASDGDGCLVTISLHKNLFSAGLDLKYVSGLSHQDEIRFFILEFIALLGRFLSLSIPSIAVVTGAAIAGGCMLSFAHDHIMVIKKGIFACNEVDIGLPLPPGMNEVVKRKHVNYKTYRDMALFGKKFSSEEALKEGMIDSIVQDLSPIIEKAHEISPYGNNRVNFRKLKSESNKVAIDACFNKQHGIGVVGYTLLPIMPKL